MKSAKENVKKKIPITKSLQEKHHTLFIKRYTIPDFVLVISMFYKAMIYHLYKSCSRKCKEKHLNISMCKKYHLLSSNTKEPSNNNLKDGPKSTSSKIVII